jgi:hypothetical protein
MWINLERIGIISIIMMAVIVFTAFVFQITQKPTYQIVYDCKEMNIRPDFPIEVKHRCEKLMKRK